MSKIAPKVKYRIRSVMRNVVEEAKAKRWERQWLINTYGCNIIDNKPF